MNRVYIGETVHYVSYGTPGGEYESACRAAIVTEIPELTPEEPNDGTQVGLCVLNPTGQFFNRFVHHDESRIRGGHWHTLGECSSSQRATIRGADDGSQDHGGDADLREREWKDV